MRRTFFQLMVAATLIFGVVSANPALASITPAQQRAEIDAALDVLAAEIQAEIDAAQATIDSLPANDPQIAVLQNTIISLSGRLSLVQMIDANLAYYPDSVLDRIIIRLDLPVSLS